MACGGLAAAGREVFFAAAAAGREAAGKPIGRCDMSISNTIIDKIARTRYIGPAWRRDKPANGSWRRRRANTGSAAASRRCTPASGRAGHRKEGGAAARGGRCDAAILQNLVARLRRPLPIALTPVCRFLPSSSVSPRRTWNRRLRLSAGSQCDRRGRPPRSDRTFRRPLRTPRPCDGQARRHGPGRPADRSCRRAGRTGSQAPPSPCHTASSAGSGALPAVPGSSPIKAHQKSGPFPPPALPGFTGTTILSDRALTPSQADGWRYAVAHMPAGVLKMSDRGVLLDPVQYVGSPHHTTPAVRSRMRPTESGR